MLASIHPLGERARGQRFVVTAVAYTAGSVVGAAASGALLGEVGGLLLGTRSSTLRALLLGAAALVVATVDGTRASLPSWHRQVNEDWLAQFRGWIYGLGFGFQLGLGWVTIVTTGAVYLTWMSAFLTAGPIAGAVVGAAFGFARALPMIANASLRAPARVAARVRTVHRWDGRFRLVTVTSEALAAGVATFLAVRGWV